MKTHIKKASSNISYLSLLSGCSLIASIGATAGAAAEDDLVVFEEIVVTAQKREQSILDVPVAVSNIGEEELDIRNFSRVEDLLLSN